MDAARAELAATHYVWAAKLARWYARSQPRLDADDAVGIASVALVECAGRYRPDRGATFTTYAGRRVLGALRDELRTRALHPVEVVSLEKVAPPAAPDPATDERLDVFRALATLPDRLRRRALLVAAGLTLEDVAALEGVTYSAVSRSTTEAANLLRDLAA